MLSLNEILNKFKAAKDALLSEGPDFLDKTSVYLETLQDAVKRASEFLKQLKEQPAARATATATGVAQDALEELNDLHGEVKSLAKPKTGRPKKKVGGPKAADPAHAKILADSIKAFLKSYESLTAGE